MNETTAASPPKYTVPPNGKEPAVEKNTASYEFNTALGAGYSIFTDCMPDIPYTNEDIQRFAAEPMLYNAHLRNLAWRAYRSNGSVTSAVDYMRSMHTLDGIPVCKCRGWFGKKPRHFKRNRELLISTLQTIRYRQFIRDALLKDANDGICFYYFETVASPADHKRFLSDADVWNIVELNQAGVNAAIISLPVDWCRIVGMQNNSPVGAFNLRYFEQFNDADLRRKLSQFPKEIRDAWTRYQDGATGEPWVKLDNCKTIITKIKSGCNEPYGIPLAVCALDDILYADYFQNTKRALLDQINNVIIYETFPEGRDKGTCALSGEQQEAQHNTIKRALNARRNKSGVTFFSLASGTNLGRITVDSSLFDEKNQSYVNDAVTASLGVASSSLNGNTKGNYATAALNLELVAGNVYAWICDIMDELNKCINANIIRDKSCVVDFYIFPATYVNRDKFFQYMKTLYSECSGSLQAVIAASGMDIEGYLSLMDYERENGFDEKYAPHQSMYTQSAGSAKGGRPSVENSENPNTIQSKANASNQNPKPSV